MVIELSAPDKEIQTQAQRRTLCRQALKFLRDSDTGRCERKGFFWISVETTKVCRHKQSDYRLLAQ